MLDILNYEFFRNALFGLLIISIAAGIIGTYIVTRRLVAISGGITHACFGGLGIGFYLGISPVLMAAAVAVASSMGVEWLSARQRMREDSAIAVVWALGMALGILFIALTPGYVPELNTFLFGNVLTISRSDLLIFAIFTLLLTLFVAWRFKQILACAFDRDFATVIGMPVRLTSYLMTIFVAVCIVLTIRLIGIMLLMSLLTMPQLIAELFCIRFRSMMVVSVIICALCSVAGLMLSAVINVPCSAFIVIFLVGTYIVVRLITAFRPQAR